MGGSKSIVEKNIEQIVNQIQIEQNANGISKMCHEFHFNSIDD